MIVEEGRIVEENFFRISSNPDYFVEYHDKAVSYNEENMDYMST